MASKLIPAAADLWDIKRIEQLAPDEASVVAARKVLKKGGFESIERTADGRGWWAFCRGLTDTYQVSARKTADRLDWDCTCPSPKRPCKHAIALLIHLSEHPEARPEAVEPATVPAADEFEPLLRGVFADPAADLPRLVFADWLDDHGEPDRASLIRVQCEAAAATKGTARAKELAVAEKKLVAAVRKSLGPIPEAFSLTFSRGFAHLTVERPGSWKPGTLPASFPDLFRRGWVEVVRFTLMTTSVERDAIPYLLQVREIDLSRFELSDTEIVGLAADLPVGSDRSHSGNRLTAVKLEPRYQPRFAAAVAGRPAAAPVVHADRPFRGVTVARLEALARDGHLRHFPLLFEGGLDDAGAVFLAGSPEVADADALQAPDGDITDDGAAALGRSTTLARVRTLDVSGNPIHAAGLTALLGGGGLPALETLQTDRTLVPAAEWVPAVLASGRVGVMVLFDGPVIVRRTAESLELRSHGAAVPGLFDRLPEACATHGVRAVVLDRFRFEPADIDRLCDLPGPTDLAITASVLRNRHVVRLAAGLGRVRPTRLNLSINEIGVAGAEALAGSLGLAAVRELNLAHNPLRLAGLKAICSSPHLGKLERLVLRGTSEEKGNVSTKDRRFLRELLPDSVAVEF